LCAFHGTRALRRLYQLKEHLGTIKTDGELAAEERGFGEIVLGADPEAVPAVYEKGGEDDVESDGEADSNSDGEDDE
jgi:hypothetical protein